MNFNVPNLGDLTSAKNRNRAERQVRRRLDSWPADARVHVGGFTADRRKSNFQMIKHVPVKLIHHSYPSPAGLTRGSIFFA